MRRFLLALVLTASAFAQQPATFRIQPVRPVEELRKVALASESPMQVGAFLRPELVELVRLDPTIKLDIRYASSNNFLSTPVYEEGRAFLQKPAAEALVRASKELAQEGFGLLIHDGYRPWYITKVFWDATPPDKHDFVADPAKGSNHNRGCAVDLTLYDLKTGMEVPMPSLYDEMSERAYPNYTGGTDVERRNRQVLRAAMERQGFTVYQFEWWHFDYKDWQRYPIMNLEFAQIPDPDFPRSPARELEKNGHKYEQPVPVHTPDPDYPEQARREHVDGVVRSWIFIGTDGLVKQTIVWKPAGHGFDEKTIQNMKAWRFKPAKRDGGVVPVMLEVENSFRTYRK